MALTRRALALALPATLALPAMPRAADAAPLTVYNAQHASLTKEWGDAFSAETGIKLAIRNGSDTELGNQIVQEGAASPADLFLTENSPAMALVQGANLFAPVDAATTALVQPFAAPSGAKWVGVAARSTVFVYNTDKIKDADLPSSIMDLATPAWKGRWAASPSGADFQAIVSAILQLEGEAKTLAWLKGMKENFTAFRGNVTVMKAVNAGEIPAGVIYHYYWAGDQARTGENSAKAKLHYFRHQDPGAFVSLSGGGVLASSKQQPEAQRFLQWIAGPKGQAILRNGTSYEYAVGRNEASNPRLVPLAELQAPMIDPATLDSRKVTALMTQAGLL